jgi:PAS domain S-box-containing protein
MRWTRHFLHKPAGTGANDFESVLAENAELTALLKEADDTLGAIRRGDVDALVVGDDIYTLDSANAASNKLRKDVLAQMEDAVVAFDNDDHIIFMNAAAERQYGKLASETLGRMKSQLYEENWPDADKRASAMQAAGELGAYRVHSIHVKADGVAIHVESTVSQLRDAGGQAIGHLAVIRDITDRVRAEEAIRAARTEQELADAALRESQARLREADRRKDEFLATLAHELRNPLAPIRNALQIMRLTDEAAIQENARGIIERQLQQMIHLVDDLLDVSRISQGKVELRREHADLAAVVQTAVETSRPLIDAGKHELTLRLPPPGALMVDVDVTRITQVIANLLNNAAKYTPQQGRIEIAAERAKDRACISVRDSGVGIPAEMLPHVFEMFAQIDRTLARAQGGLGIGLALVKSLVELHGGSVEAHSEGHGLGSRFVINLPLTVADAQIFPHAPTSMLTSPHSKNIRVLVVDDNVDSADSLSQCLRMLGYQTLMAHDGLEAVRSAESYNPDVALLDIGLPHMSGYEAARQIRAQPQGAQLLLIALSGWGQEEDRRKSKAAGFDHHFVKPVDIDELTNVLAKHELHLADSALPSTP